MCRVNLSTKEEALKLWGALPENTCRAILRSIADKHPTQFLRLYAGALGLQYVEPVPVVKAPANPPTFVEASKLAEAVAEACIVVENPSRAPSVDPLALALANGTPPPFDAQETEAILKLSEE